MKVKRFEIFPLIVLPANLVDTIVPWDIPAKALGDPLSTLRGTRANDGMQAQLSEPAQLGAA